MYLEMILVNYLRIPNVCVPMAFNFLESLLRVAAVCLSVQVSCVFPSFIKLSLLGQIYI